MEGLSFGVEKLPQPITPGLAMRKETFVTILGNLAIPHYLALKFALFCAERALMLFS
jgi:hypothetical protein